MTFKKLTFKILFIMQQFENYLFFDSKNLPSSNWFTNKNQPFENWLINDNKNLSQFFIFKYLYFISLNKGITVNSKKDLIKMLQKNPKPGLTGLLNLSSELKNFDRRLSYTLEYKKLHPYKVIKSNKITKIQPISTEKTNKIQPISTQNKDLKDLKDNKDNKDIKINKNNKNNKNKLSQFKTLLKSKIKIVKNSLSNSKLAFPVNLLNPLLSYPYIREILSTGANKKKSSAGGAGGSNLLDFNNLWKSIEFKKILVKYNLKNLNQISNTKYLQLITPFKVVNKYQQNIIYNFSKSKYSNIKIDNIITLLEYAFRSMSCLISKPVFLETPNKLIINLFYYFIPGKINRAKKNKRLKRLGLLNVNKYKFDNFIWANQTNTTPAAQIYMNLKKKRKLAIKKARLLTKKFALRVLFSPKNLEKLNKLTTILSRIFNKTVVLDLIPLKLPFFDDNILVKAIGIICNNVSARTIFKFVFRKAIIYSKVRANLKSKYSLTRSYLSGIKIRIGGRLMTQKVIPRISTREMQRGPISHRKVAFVDWSRVVLKNRRGAHSITVTMSHVI